jgi:tetratricopeptide (TPR) repeat protein
MPGKLGAATHSSVNPGLKAGTRLFSAVSVNSARFLAISLFAVLACSTAVFAQDGTPKPNGSISGTVYTQPDNRPASQVAVSLKSHEAGIFRSILTDYDGHFEFSALPQGTYEISIEEQGFEPFHSTAQFDGPSLKLELHITSSTPSRAPESPYTVSARELKIPGKAHDEFNKGLDRLAKKDQNGSLSHFMKAVQLFPGYFEALYHQGIVQTNLGQLQKAMQAFQKALVLSGGRYARALFGIGYLHYLQGNAAEAETTIRKGLEIDPNSPDGYVVLGMTLLRLNRPDEAEKSAREALLRNPNTANAYLVLADSCAHRQNYREQIQDLDSYLRLEPAGPASQRAHEVREVAQRILNRTQPQD